MFVVAATALALPWTKAIVAANYDRNHELRELIGTSSFNVSISHRQASNESPR